MAALLDYLPSDEGLLPKWLFFVGVVAVGNSIQAYSNMYYTQRVYNGPASPPASKSASAFPKPSKGVDPLIANSPVTPLSARTFGTWSLLQGLVRLVAAYDIRSRSLYGLALATYFIGAGHFLSEWLWFRTTQWDRALAGPVIITLGSIVWMSAQWQNYLE